MALAEVQQQRLATDEVIELIWERVLSEEFPNVAEAARKMWVEISPRLSSDDLDFFALEGLIHLTKREQAHQHRGGTEGRPAIGYGAPHGKKWDKYIALTWPYEAADGQAKPLIEFSKDDLSAFAARAGTFVQAWTRRRDWAVETSKVLEEHGVERVRDLPAAALAQVNEGAREAMGRQE